MAPSQGQLHEMSCCERLGSATEHGPSALTYIPKFREWGVRVLDGGSSHLVIQYCPWCGLQLPRALRSEWFARLENLGLEPEDPAVPEEMASEQWWRSEGL